MHHKHIPPFPLQSKTEEQPPNDGRVDSYEVCTFMKISSKTLQRLRAANEINYPQIRGKTFTVSAKQRVC